MKRAVLAAKATIVIIGFTPGAVGRRLPSPIQRWRASPLLRGEGFVVTVTRAVEVCEKHDRVLVGGCGLQRLRRRPGALEGCAPPELDGVPANAFAGETPGQRALADVAGAAKAAGRLGEAGLGVVGAAARECRGTGWEAFDVGGVEAEAGLAVARQG